MLNNIYILKGLYFTPLTNHTTDKKNLLFTLAVFISLFDAPLVLNLSHARGGVVVLKISTENL